MDWQRHGYTISDDPARVDVDAVHRYLSEESYWASGIPRDVVERSIAGSMPFGLYAPDGSLAGFARAVTDRAVFAYLADVFVLEAHRGRGLGVWLMEVVMDHPDLQGLRRWVLYTADAHGLYRRFGFGADAAPDRYMERSREPGDLYGLIRVAGPLTSAAMLGRISLRARAAALLPLAALAVHDLRYRLAYGGDAGRELTHQGHAYMDFAKPVVGMLCALVAAELVARLARAWRVGEAGERAWSRRRLWAFATGALAAVFFGQELIEGAIFAGHPGGLAGVIGAGGWVALPLCVAAGGLLTLLLAGARVAARALAARHSRRPARGSRTPARRAPAAVAARRLAPLASAAAGRAPPRPAQLPA